MIDNGNQDEGDGEEGENSQSNKITGGGENVDKVVGNDGNKS